MSVAFGEKCELGGMQGLLTADLALLRAVNAAEVDRLRVLVCLLWCRR